MKKLSYLAGAAFLAVAAAGVAVAQGPGPRPDRNADVTRAQVIERTDSMFARLDADNDGRFTREEARARGEQRREQRMTRLFDRLDADRNGSITREEMAQARAHRRGRGGPGGPGADGRRGGPGGPGMRHRGPRHGGPGGPGMRGQRMFGEQGFVTREQFRERALARFDRVDANHDGTVTAAERQAMRGQRRQHRQERRGQPN